MSAFIVDYRVIDDVLSIRLNHDILNKHCYLKSQYENLFTNNNKGDYYIYENLEQLGKEFLKLNIESVNYRYNDNESLKYAENYKFKDSKPSLVQAIKSIECLMYQSCEIENYKQNETYQKMEKLKNYLITAFLYLNEEYKKAEWGNMY